jgi:hypothetical protein
VLRHEKLAVTEGDPACPAPSADIHGCPDALASIQAAIDPQPHDTIITLGDHRGMDGKKGLP